MRIHNLPGSRRLPHGEADERELLYRNNVVASAVLGIGAQCIVVLTEWRPFESFTSWPVAESAPAWTLTEDLRESLATAIFRWKDQRWSPGALDDEILAVARGQAGSLIVFSPHTRGAFCPYDGGADLILPDPADAEAFRRLFAAWRSPLPSGL
jgi:hypothetical protein